MRPQIVYRPLGQWPRPQTHADDRRSRPFKANYQATLDLLERELRHLDVDEAVIELKVDDYWIRNDGKLRGDAKVDWPGVILSFDSPVVGSLRYPCDSCDLWRHNVRAIALALESLRAVDRYGVTSRAEQYTGWAKIAAAPPPSETIPKNQREAFDVLKALAELPPGKYSRDSLIETASNLVRKFHPDRPEGDVHKFKQAQASLEILQGAVA